MKNGILFLLSLLLLLPSAKLTAQNNTGIITGTVIDTRGTPVMFANVVLLNEADSSIAKVEVTDDAGVFSIVNVPAGSYYISIRYVGLLDYHSEQITVIPDQTVKLSMIKMEEAQIELEEVVVEAKKPLLELKPDKMVMNVQGSVNAIGSDALELLRKSPGVVVDNNENISMLGKSGVRIYIDGKPSPLRGEDLAAFLKTIQSSEIDAIEIITNPSAKYDAEGNAGIINIRMKKDKRLGSNANLNVGYDVGEVARYNSSINGNYRNKKLNIFGNLGFADGKYKGYQTIYREQSGFWFDQNSFEGSQWESYNFKLGTDFFLNDQHTIGFLFHGYNTGFNWNSDSQTPIGTIGNFAVDSTLVANSLNDGDRNNLDFNLNYRFDDGTGTTWSVDADFGRFRNQSSFFQPNYYYSPDWRTLQERITTSDMPTDIDIYTLKADYERPIWKGQLGVGLKSSYVHTDNAFDFYNLVDEVPVLDIDRTNQFGYKENINAAYLNYSRQFNEKWNLQLGLRLEQTNSSGELISAKPTDDDHVVRHYLDFFPSGGLSFAPHEKHSFNLSYSRRINRPSYQDLNPFEYKLDELTFRRGDPFLRPEYAHSIQLTHSFNYRLNTTLGFSHTKDLITNLTDTSGVKATYISWRNLADQYNYSLSFSSPISITDWWSSYSNLTAYYTHNKADFGDGKTIDLDVYAMSIYSQQTFQLPWKLSFELSGWYASPSIWGGNFEADANWSVDAGLQKKIWNERGNIKLSVSDIFKSSDWHVRSVFGELLADINGGWDSRRLKLSFSYLIGNTQVKAAKNRKTGLEEEKSRIKTEH